MKLVALVLLSGCHLVGVGRVSAGMTATSEGAIGVAFSGELGGGFIAEGSPSGPPDMGEIVSMSAGGEATMRGVAFEVSERVDLVFPSDSELRVGARAGFLLRSEASQVATELAVVRAHYLASGNTLGIEARVGPLLGLHHDDTTFDGIHGYVGVVYTGLRAGKTHDPIKGLFDGVGKH